MNSSVNYLCFLMLMFSFVCAVILVNALYLHGGSQEDADVETVFYFFLYNEILSLLSIVNTFLDKKEK